MVNAYPFILGLDRFLTQTKSTQPSYPKFDCISVDENTQRIDFAVAGFSEDEIEILHEKDTLIVKGSQKPVEETGTYLVSNIAKRDFTIKFTLFDYFEPVSSEMKNGILKVTLVRNVPEEKKPKKIEIKSS